MSTPDTAAEQLLDLARKQAQQAEVYMVSYTETPVSFEANRLKNITTREAWGLALRVIKDGRIGFAAGNGATDLQALADAAAETAQFGAQAHFDMPGRADYPTVEVFDPAVEALPVDQLVQAGQSAIDQVVRRTEGLLCDASVRRRVASVTIESTRPVRGTCRLMTPLPSS